MEDFVSKLQCQHDKIQFIRKSEAETSEPEGANRVLNRQTSLVLSPIIKELDKLVAADIRLLSGQKLEYFRLEDYIVAGALSIKVNTPRPIFITDVHGSGYHNKKYVYTRVSNELSHLNSHPGLQIQSLQEVFTRLAQDLAPEISNLGSLDKNLYSKQTQDTIGIE